MIERYCHKSRSSQVKGLQLSNAAGCVVVNYRKFVCRRPAFDSLGFQFVYPLLDLHSPGGDIVILYVRDHRSPHMRCSMMTGLEALDATGGRETAVEIFPFITVGTRGCRQPLALNREQRLILGIFSAVDPDDRSPRRYSQIDRSPGISIVRLFAAELKEVPSRIMAASTGKTCAKLGGQGILARPRKSFWIVAPTGQDLANETDQRCKPFSGEMNRAVERPGVSPAIAFIGQHLEALPT